MKDFNKFDLLRPTVVQLLAQRIHPFMRDGDPHEWGEAIKWAVDTLTAIGIDLCE